jgi:polysaccharide deacetylase
MKPLASLSLDLDNKWSYMKTHGDPTWKWLPSYLDVVVPRFLAMLDDRGLHITVFIVGQDAALAANRDTLRSIADAGHEIGNHSFHHEPWLHLYSANEIEREIAQAEESIEQATGRRPVGFRGPGFSLSESVLTALVRRGYRYDASTFPTFLGPLARAYYFMTAKLSPEERRKRGQLFGDLREGLRPIHPYSWTIDGREIIEIPVTTMPGFRVPIHMSYLLYLATFSPSLALNYFRAALALCSLAQVQPSLLLHPLDFLGEGEAPELAFFPAMRTPVEEKLLLVDRALALYCERYHVVTVGEHAQHAARRANLARVEPRYQWS